MASEVGNTGGDGNPSVPELGPGSMVAGGRYRLVAPHGGAEGLQYWEARDSRLNRPVALVFVDSVSTPAAPSRSSSSSTSSTPAASSTEKSGAGSRSSSDVSSSASAGSAARQGHAPRSISSAARILDETLTLSSMWAPGTVGILDIVRGKAGGIIVAEWTPGRSLAAAYRDAGSHPAKDAESLRELAEAAAHAHDRRLVLGIRSPDQLRVTEDGRAVLTFPGITPSASREEDVASLGAVLYASLTGTWPNPLPEGAEKTDVTDERLPIAERDAEGKPVDPQAGGAPVDLSLLATRTLDGSSVSSASTVISLIDAAGQGGFGPEDPEYYADSRESGEGSSWEEEATESEIEDKRARDQNRWLIMAGAGIVGVIVVVALLITFMGGFGSKDEVPLADKLDAMQRSQTSSRDAGADDEAEDSGEQSSTESTSSSAAPAGEKLDITSAETWQPASSAGSAENSALATNVTDGDPSTVWQTDTYEQQFGTGPSAFKPGLGLLLSLQSPAELSRLELDSPDRSMTFEVRSSATANPTSLTDTQVIGKGRVTGGKATVELDSKKPVDNVLVWITELDGSSGSGFQAKIGELELLGSPA